MTYCSVIKSKEEEKQNAKLKKVICLANLKLFLVRYKLGAFSYRYIAFCTLSSVIWTKMGPAASVKFSFGFTIEPFCRSVVQI